MRPLRVYVDTSVFGGMFEIEHEERTRRFFRMVGAGHFRLVVSDQVKEEVDRAPDETKRFFAMNLPSMEYLRILPVVSYLADLYVVGKAVSEAHRSDAMHVAYASIYKCDGVISWNFRHMVKPKKSLRFNMLNVDNGFSQLFIASPEEITDEINR